MDLGKLSKKKTIYLSFLVLFIFLSPIVVFAYRSYTKSLITAVNSSFSDFISEIVNHDTEIISDKINDIYSSLYFVQDFLKIEYSKQQENEKNQNLNSNPSLLTYYFHEKNDFSQESKQNQSLNVDSKSNFNLNLIEQNLFYYLPQIEKYNDFLDLAFIDSDGNFTSNTYLKHNSINVIQDFMNANSKLILKYTISSNAPDTLIHNVKNRDLVMLGIPLNDYKLHDKELVALVCLYDLNKIKHIIEISEFENKNLNFVFTENGDFVTPSVVVNSINETFSNFYEQMSHVILKDMDFESLTKRIKSKESFFFVYKNKNGGPTINAKITPISNTNCYYFMAISEELLKAQSVNVLKYSTVIIIILCVVIFLFLIITMFTVKSVSQLRLESKAKEEFLSTMSHEIRTPLNGIIGLIYLMKNNINDKEKLNYYFQKTAKTSDYLLQLINNILDISKFDNGKIKLANNPFDLEDMIESIVSINRDVIAKKNITFETKENIFCTAIYGDEIRIQQIIMNLIGNAIKFTDEGGKISLSVIQENTFETDEISTIFTVTDTGCGISKDFQKHIFEAFSQERNKLKTSQKGTGLGLAISQMLSDQMGGNLSVESELGKGSTFTFTLSSKIATQKQVSDFILSSTVTNTDKELNILIAEDNELNADILDEIFSEVNYKHKIVHDGKQVIETFEDSDINEFDVILMDIQMPYYDGYEATQIIRKMKRSDAKTVKILACSANTFEEDKENAYKAGMNGFIVKPVNINSLLETLGK